MEWCAFGGPSTSKAGSSTGTYVCHPTEDIQTPLPFPGLRKHLSNTKDSPLHRALIPPKSLHVIFRTIPKNLKKLLTSSSAMTTRTQSSPGHLLKRWKGKRHSFFYDESSGKKTRQAHLPGRLFRHPDIQMGSSEASVHGLGSGRGHLDYSAVKGKEDTEQICVSDNQKEINKILRQ